MIQCNLITALVINFSFVSLHYDFNYINYFFQHNLDQIKSLSKKWLNVCQEALRSLFNKLNENENSNIHTIEDLIKSLGIFPDLIQFDSNNQEFY